MMALLLSSSGRRKEGGFFFSVVEMVCSATLSRALLQAHLQRQETGRCRRRIWQISSNANGACTDRIRYESAS